MPRVTFVKAARKDNPVCKKGESYYWWKFRYGGKRYSLTPPKQSQLTQSPYYANLYDLQDSIEEGDCSDSDSFESLRDQVAESLQEFGQECQESLDNMPDSLTYSPTGELLQERVDACESASSDVEGLEEFDEDEPTEDEFEEDCPECDGSGEIDVEDGEEGETDSCDNCDGGGEAVNQENFAQEKENWEQRQQEHYESQKSEMSDYVSNCFC